MSDDPQDLAAGAVASLRSALASGNGVRDALRNGFAQHAAFFTSVCSWVLQYALGPNPKPAEIAEFVARLRASQAEDESPGFQQHEVEAFIRGTFGDMSAIRSVRPQVITSTALPVALTEAAFARWRPTPSELDELFATAAESVRYVRAIVPANLWAEPGDPARAREEALARFKPTAADAEPLILRARTWAAENMPAEALADYDSAIILDPANVAGLTERGILRDRLGRHDDALADFDRVISLDPANIFALQQRAHIRYKVGRHADTMADWDRVITLDPGNAHGYVGRGMIRAQEEQYELAFADYDRAVQLDPASKRALTGRAETLCMLGRYPEALADACRAVEDEPDGDAYFCRADIYHHMGRYEDALADYGRALAADPAATWQLVPRAVTYQAMGRHEDALADLNRAIELNPGEAWMLVARGSLFEEMGREADAKADYARAIELEPSYAGELDD